MQPAACGLYRISYDYLTWVAMWDRYFRQRAYIGITRSCMRWYVRKTFFAHRIRISEILPWVRKSYPIQAILPRRSREGSVRWLYWNSRTWSSIDVIVMFK